MIKYLNNSKKGDAYIVFENHNKSWIINETIKDKGLDMYQPSSRKGKKVKNYIKYLSNMAEKRGRIKKKFFALDNEVDKKIKQVYNMDRCWYSFYVGEDSTWQNDKMTIQVCEKNGDNSRILGYVKITDNSRVKRLFDNEVEAIKYLTSAGFEFTSNILFVGQVGDFYLLAQDTNKTSEKSIKFKFNRDILELVKDMTSNTIVDISYEESDIYYYIDYLKKIDKEIYKYDVILKAIKYVEERLEEEKIEYAFSHGDFTPWNIYEDFKLKYIIDFEYAAKAMPRYMDVFHYMTQYAFLTKQGDVGTAVGLFRNKRKMLCDYIGCPELICAMYLLYIISFYIQRADEYIEDDIYKNRVEFLEYIINRNVN